MSKEEKIYSPKEEIINAFTHAFGALFAIYAIVMLVYTSKTPIQCATTAIYGAMLFILFEASTCYHAMTNETAKKVFRKIDHSAIYLLIAGTYTPYALVALPKALGWTIFGIEWGCAILGIVLNSIDLKKYKVFSMILYLVMGWMIVFSFKPLMAAVDIGCIYISLAAGVIYTIGAIFYGIGKKKKYMHSIFHFFVLAASILFFFAIFLYII